MNTLIIEPNTKSDYQLFVSLAKRLNVTFREEKAKIKTKNEQEDMLFAKAKQLKKKLKEEAFFALAGSFEDLDTDAMIKDIEESRTTKDIDTLWN
ncbi:hypothetical protein LV89_04381 [Arcicella aurantiaca]|uniref:Uncharacterized protein n=1 Tax=Arcicella aurantiaca TaxID=591202 RepID=A0A316DIE9_9BACT|nr:hypothetical protein [Arcicella aurantiaca]PWK17466.1 hypothetical protein LV89_04381 [Arcicella aurantiaca]